jgi:hypothetical protein
VQSHFEEGEFDAEKDSSEEAPAEEAGGQRQREVGHLAEAEVAVSGSHALAIEQAPPHESVDQAPLILAYFPTSHAFELIGQVEVAVSLALAVVDEEGVLGISVSEEVEGLLLETHEHSRTKYYILHHLRR